MCGREREEEGREGRERERDSIYTPRYPNSSIGCEPPREKVRIDCLIRGEEGNATSSWLVFAVSSQTVTREEAAVRQL